MNMKYYNLNTQFTFGKKVGKTILQVSFEEPGYLSFCLINLDHFIISHETIEEIQCLNAKFKLSKQAEEEQNNKLIALEKIEAAACFENDDFDDDDDYGRSGEKYGWYNGWSDDAIDDAFEGDPMNTWNVD